MMASITIARPLAASLVFAALLVASGGAVAVAWSDLSAAQDERDAKAELLARSVEVGRRAGLPPGGGRVVDPFVAADSATLAAARIDALVRNAADGSGRTLVSTRAEAKGDQAGLGTRIEAQALVDGDNDALQAMLLGLETGEPTMLVDALAIEPVETASDKAAPSPRLRMTITLSAFWRGPRS